ncbi:MAG: P-loop NTPase fold protein [Clostridia bacterium]
MNLGRTDVPTNSIKQDLFHIETYISGLSTFITQCDTPMTVSIQGDWGSGKTSMMNMIKENINNSVFAIWFNTWQFSQFDMGNSLILSMMEVLLNKLGCEQSVINKVMSGIGGFVRKAVKVATDNVAGGAAADIVDEMITFDNSSNYANEILQLKDKFQEAVNKKISETKKERVVVFVDDLDRLQPEKAVELLEVLKLFLDCENCVFVIAVDYDVVTRGIRNKYGLDISEEKGKSFFDKIIQLPFKVPVAQYDIKNYVSDMLKNMNVSTTANEVDLYVNLIRTSIGLNPRSVKRLFNTYQLLNIITKSSVTSINEAALHKNLFAVICMQMGHEKMYQYLSTAPIEAELIENLANDETLDSFLQEIFAEEREIIENAKYYAKLKKFIGYFYKALQSDDDMAISETELNNLQSVLVCSSIVSVNDNDETSDNDEMSLRHSNKRIVEQVNSYLSDLCQMKVWLPRKAREGVKISDVSSYTVLKTKENLDFQLEYYLSRKDKNSIGVYIIMYNKSPKCEQKFLEYFSDNPLNLDRTPEKESWGRIMYPDVIIVTEDEAVQKISELFRKAYSEAQKF